MKRALTFIAVAGAIALATSAEATVADVVDQIKNRVDAIKKETATIKSKTNDLQAKTEEMASQLSAQIQETVSIKDALAPLFGLKDRFSGMGFDPTEFLDLVDNEEMKNLIAGLKEKRQEAEDRLNDPGLQSFRQEFVEVLQGISSIISEDGVAEATPLQTLVEKAPLPLLALIKASTQPVFTSLKREVLSAAAEIDELRAAGVFDLRDTLNAHAVAPWPTSSWNALTACLPAEDTSGARLRGKSAYAALTQAQCASIEGLRPLLLDVHLLRISLSEITFHLKRTANEVEAREGNEKVVEIHGYVGFSVEPGKYTKTQLERFILNIEHTDARIGHAMDLLAFAKESGLCPAETASHAPDRSCPSRSMIAHASSPAPAPARPARTRRAPSGTGR